MDGSPICFGPFQLFQSQRLLLEGDMPVRIGDRAFDILAALIERAGEIVGKDELIARAWPKTSVEDANLNIQVSALRRVLGDGQSGRRYIVVITGQGYSFVAPVRAETLSSTAAPVVAASAAPHNLPFAVTRMIGREETVAALLSRFSRNRLLTIVGPGGIGKTTVGLAVAERSISAYEHGVWLVDLAPLADPRLVPSAAATVLGVEVRAEDALPGLIAALRHKRALLLLDNCEHVIDAAASLASALLNAAPDVAILATSREPLQVAGETEHRLAPLGSPQSSTTRTAAEAAAFPAVQLFVERVTAVVDDFALTDANAPLVAEICRKLDGLPLAIEFAAPRVAALGIEGLVAGLDYNLPLLGTRRATMGRHRTMRTVIDWSYGLLSKDEQLFFRALGIFAGGLTVEAAAAVSLGAANARIEAMDRLADLVDKSLVVADFGGAEPRFRLFDTTRAYAIEKLDESGERDRIARRHAEYYRVLFERAEGEVAARPRREWLADYAREVDNVRAALDWAFSLGGDGSLGVALTAAAGPLWTRLSLLDECRSRAKQALGALEGTRNLRDEMRLYAALGASTYEELGAAFTKVLDLAESLGDIEHQLRAFRGLYFHHAGSGRYRTALPFAQRFRELAVSGSDRNDWLFGERMMGVAKHCLGDQIGARRHLEQVLTDCVAAPYRTDAIGFGTDLHVVRFNTDLRISARVYIARAQWLQGYSDQAIRTAEISVEEALATGHALSLSYALALAACPIALWVGNLAAAERYTGALLDHSRRNNLRFWTAFGSRFQRVVSIRSGDFDTALQQPRTGLDEAADPYFNFRFLTGLIELAEALAHTGRIAEGLALVEAGIEQSEEGWLTPELLRLKGELLLSQSPPAVAGTAMELFGEALDLARRQGALSWELRAATSLARLLRSQGRRAGAIASLEPVYGRFTEGFGNADLAAAKRLLDELANAGRH
jgi:predicted ATPase/DNA-binding winged helix-turn-helix (wHTH) protein